MGIGTRGPGETQLETDRRIVRKRISDLKFEIEKIQERKSRLVSARNREHFTVCIVGYTNAGKSTLFNTLTAAGTYADDKLFATLDTKTRAETGARDGSAALGHRRLRARSAAQPGRVVQGDAGGGGARGFAAACAGC